jgi:energy-coupling factor transporter ATP-binding protein EcfA2
LRRRRAMTRIKSLKIDGLRGVRSQASFDLDGKSLLLYGENGSGKSCVTDALEWFLFNKIGHLASEEINALEALRNIFLGNDDKGSVTVDFGKAEYSSVKSVYPKKGGLTGEHSNKSSEFALFLKEVGKENLILRYCDLIGFVTAPKGEKLKELSSIIGFSEVTSTRDVLKKIVNSLGRELRLKTFDTQIAQQQRNIVEQIGQNITDELQFVSVVKNLVAPLGLAETVTKVEDVDTVLAAIKQPADDKVIAEQTLYSKIHDLISNLSIKTDDFSNLYTEYRVRFQEIAEDVEKLKKIAVEVLLQSGLQVLNSGAIEEDTCPLCLQPKNTTDLMKELIIRIEKLNEYKTEIEELGVTRDALEKEILQWLQKMQALSTDATLSREENKEIRANLEGISSTLGLLSSELRTKLDQGKSLKQAKDVLAGKKKYDELAKMCTDRIEQLKATRKNDSKFEAHSKIVLTQKALTEIQRLKKEKEIIERRKDSFDLIYADFARRQKHALEIFLSRFSGSIDEYYQFMNVDEKVEDIRLVPIENNDELAGITISFKFHDAEASPPHKYLSESHLNCLGIAFFLASVKAFNRISSFLVLDDVISSFDTNHRKRLADLLLEKFSDYQLIVLTHERNWYEYLANAVRGKAWKINVVKWGNDTGTYVDEPTEHIKARIESKLGSGQLDAVGNEIRKYLEHILKEIAFNLEVKVRYLYNDTNEDRMVYELLTELKAKINKHAGPPLKGAAIIDRLLASSFIANKDSHDSAFVAEGGDFRAIWKDVRELEDLCYCGNCGRCLSLKHHDDVNKLVRCGCTVPDAKSCDWKK